MISLRQAAHALVWTKRHLLGELRVEEIEAVRPLLRPGDVCLDIGAHGGSWTIPLSRMVPDGHVYAFEALPYYARTLAATLRLLGARNVTLVAKAVKDDETPVPMVWKSAEGSHLSGLTHVARPGEAADPADCVPATTLDRFCEGLPGGRIAFVKCDVEGAELKVLRGAKRMIEKFRPAFYLEVNDQFCRAYGYSAADVFAFLEERGYRGHVVGAGGALAPTSAPGYPGMGDVLFLPE